MFSDETKFYLYNNDIKSFIWKKKGDKLNEKNIKKTVKFNGGNLMFWGCISINGVGNLEVIDTTMDKYKYINIIRHSLNNSAKKMNLETFKFQQDNDPNHKSKYAQEYFENKNIQVIEWPSNSPDLNPIEHIWAYMKNKLSGKIFKKKEDLVKEVKEIWENISPEFCRRLVLSMDNRIIEVLRSNGGYSKY